MPVRVSVALCTFNGQAHLAEQLRTLLEQRRRPDELIVRDDRSTDGTVQMLRRFGDTAPFAVSIAINQTTLGPAKNFERAIADCTGDVIVLCDQDDLWLPDKLGAVENEFAANPRLGAFFSDANMCDANGESLGYRLWTSVGLTSGLLRRLRRGSAFDVILRQNIVTGATLAFAGRLKPLILPVDPRWMHDGWIALLISACAEVYAEPRQLIRYRQHPLQTIGAARRSLFQQYLNARKMDRTVFAEQAEMYQAVLNRLEDFLRSPADPATGAGCPPPKHLQRLAEKVRHCRTRSAIRLGHRSRFLPSLMELLRFRYRRFSLGWKSFAQDLFL